MCLVVLVRKTEVLLVKTKHLPSPRRVFIISAHLIDCDRLQVFEMLELPAHYVSSSSLFRQTLNRLPHFYDASSSTFGSIVSFLISAEELCVLPVLLHTAVRTE